jgi:hypothetical protein
MGDVMKTCLGIFLGLLLIGASPTRAAADYKYAHNDAEYSVMLPEAPTVETVWADSENIPYLDNPPKDAALGEIATFRRADADTNESFNAKITFLKADSDFLSKLTEDGMKAALENDFKDVNLTDKKFDFSTNAGTNLKWATLSGFSIDRYGHPSYNAGHYLTGKQSILVLKVQYSVDNKTFADNFKKLTDNITYLAP